MPNRLFAGARITFATAALALLGFVFAWPVGVAVVVYMLWGERFGWRPRVEAFVAGYAGGLRRGSCQCGPAALFETGEGGCDVAEARRRVALPGDDRGVRRG